MFIRTIVSLVTAPINQNIAIIRISGPKTYQIIKKIFKSKSSEWLLKNEKKILLGSLLGINKKIIDQVILLCFYKPESFTGEDTVEINCHGNVFIVNEIIKNVLQLGANLALPGEFTKQAFFNKKINLIQANSINEIIKAPSLTGAHLALHNLNKSSQAWLEEIEEELLEIIANIKVNIDYPEYDSVVYLTSKQVLPRLQSIFRTFKLVKEKSEKAKFYQQGIKVVIVGKPNVGKSTLLNALVGEERVIVSDQPGTTRDSIEVSYQIKGIPISLIDTAGIRKTENDIEKLGIIKSKSLLKKADIVLFMLDFSEVGELTDEEREIYNSFKSKEHLIIINKIDKLEEKKIDELVENFYFDKKKIVKVSAKKKEISELERKFIEIFSIDNILISKKELPFLSQAWQISRIKKVINKITFVIKELELGVYLDAVCGELETIYSHVREMTGKDYKSNLLDTIFSKFCLGK